MFTVFQINQIILLTRRAEYHRLARGVSTSPPLIENRLISWFTYYFGLDGFLRRDYAIWPNDLWNRPSYKFPIWKAGDMFFVYPGNDGNLIYSTHCENL
ncbi:MAG: glycoside hydrolase domain-containing protein [Candidatus Helarchaeota archaeon]